MTHKIKLLGVTITFDLKWEAHISTTNQANISLAFLKQLAKYQCPASHILKFYISFIRPTLEYAYPLWHFSLNKNQTKRLGSVQKRALKIITREGSLPYSYFLENFKIKTLEKKRHDLYLRFSGNARTNI
jgi:hypothetical protein